MISLVLATYNGEKYIKKQLDSIRTQTLAPDEVIIRDDHSGDSTVLIIQAYINEYNLSAWRLVVNEKNLGYKKNFFLGISEALGDYVFLCDQDDIWKKNKIERMLDVFKTHPEIWSVNCSVQLIDSKDMPLSYRCESGWQNANFLYAPNQLRNLSFFNLEYILKHNITPGCAMAIDNRTKKGFIHTYRMGMPHDWYMNMIAAANGGCAFLNENLINYRCHTSNTIGSNTGVVKGIRNKTREVRVEDYQSRIDGCKSVCDYYNINLPNTKLIEDMISFYRLPTPYKLLKLKSQSGYKELAKRKVKLWELLVSFHVDEIIRKIVRKIGGD